MSKGICDKSLQDQDLSREINVFCDMWNSIPSFVGPDFQ